MSSQLEKANSAAAVSTSDLDKQTLSKRPYRLKTTPFGDIVQHNYSGTGTEEDPYLVEWLPNDPENPMNWSTTYKWLITVLVAVATLCVSLSSSAYTGATRSIIETFNIQKDIIVTLGVSLFVLGFGFGPLLWAPLSEIFGRRTMYIGANLLFTMWQGVAVASPNITALLFFRFLSGFFGASPLVNSGGTLADMFTANQRGLAMAIFAAAPFLGPALGPVTGGFLGEVAGWQWVLAYVAIFAAVVTGAGILLLPETYAPVLLRTRAKKLSKVTGKHYICKLDKGKDLRLKQLFSVALGRPWVLLIREPIVLILSIYVAIIYGTLYSLFGAFPIVFQQNRGWSPGVGGLAFLGVLVGMLFAVAYIIWIENPRYVRVANKCGGAAPPEARLPSCMVGAVTVVVGLAIFAATDGPDIHWSGPIIGSAPFGFGMVLIFLSVMNYLTDSYLIYAASVLAANSVIRSLFGFAFPLFTPNMYTIGGKNGIHWGPAIAGFLALGCLPFPFLFAKYGESIRVKCKYAADAAAYLDQLRGPSNSPEKKEDKEGNPEGPGSESDAHDDPEALREYGSSEPHPADGGNESRPTSSRSHSSSGHA